MRVTARKINEPELMENNSNERGFRAYSTNLQERTLINYVTNFFGYKIASCKVNY